MIPNKRYTMTFSEWGVEPGRQKKRGNTLDEITNRVFEDLLKGKSEQNFDELGILDFDARSSRVSSIMCMFTYVHEILDWF